MSETSGTQDTSEFVLESFIPFQLSVLSNLIGEGISQAYRKHYWLSVTEWRVLAIVGRFPGLTASEVMARGAMDKVAVSRAVKKLLERGMIERREHSEDRRRRPLTLTRGKGQSLYHAVVPKALAYEATLLNVLGGEEREVLERMLEKLLDAAARLNQRSGDAFPEDPG